MWARITRRPEQKNIVATLWRAADSFHRSLSVVIECSHGLANNHRDPLRGLGCCRVATKSVAFPAPRGCRVRRRLFRLRGGESRKCPRRFADAPRRPFLGHSVGIARVFPGPKAAQPIFTGVCPRVVGAACGNSLGALRRGPVRQGARAALGTASREDCPCRTAAR